MFLELSNGAMRLTPGGIMKFVDEAEIVVEAGNGGSGALSFRREKYIERGGLTEVMAGTAGVFSCRPMPASTL